MRAKTNIFTVTKANKVLLVDTNLVDFLKGFEKIEANAPHYNTLYNNFAKGKDYEKDGYYFQKFSSEQKIDTDLSSENPK